MDQIVSELILDAGGYIGSVKEAAKEIRQQERYEKDLALVIRKRGEDADSVGNKILSGLRSQGVAVEQLSQKYSDAANQAKKGEISIKDMAMAVGIATTGFGLAQQGISAAVKSFGELLSEAKRSGPILANYRGDMQGAQEATSGLASKVDIASAALKLQMLGVNLNDQQFQDLLRSVTKVSGVMGVDMKSALSDVSTALGRQSTMIFDNLGVTFKLEDAHKAFADANHKTVESLTASEKALAFQAMGLGKLKENADKLNTTLQDQWAIWDKLKTQVHDAASEFIRTDKSISGVINVLNYLYNVRRKGAEQDQREAEERTLAAEAEAHGGRARGIDTEYMRRAHGLVRYFNKQKHQIDREAISNREAIITQEKEVEQKRNSDLAKLQEEYIKSESTRQAAAERKRWQDSQRRAKKEQADVLGTAIVQDADQMARVVLEQQYVAQGYDQMTASAMAYNAVEKDTYQVIDAEIAQADIRLEKTKARIELIDAETLAEERKAERQRNEMRALERRSQLEKRANADRENALQTNLGMIDSSDQLASSIIGLAGAFATGSESAASSNDAWIKIIAAKDAVLDGIKIAQHSAGMVGAIAHFDYANAAQHGLAVAMYGIALTKNLAVASGALSTGAGGSGGSQPTAASGGGAAPTYALAPQYQSQSTTERESGPVTVEVYLDTKGSPSLQLLQRQQIKTMVSTRKR